MGGERSAVLNGIEIDSHCNIGTKLRYFINSHLYKSNRFTSYSFREMDEKVTNFKQNGVCRCDFSTPVDCEMNVNSYMSEDIFADRHRDGSVEFPLAFHKSHSR